jgi:hypothetical protein
MPYYTPDDINIDVEDFFYEMSNKECKEMYDLLIEDGYGESLLNELNNQPQNLIEWEFQGIMEKIISNRLALTSEEDEMLRKIASRF